MKKRILMIIGAVILLAGLILGGFGISRYLQEKNAGESYDDLRVEFDVDPLVDIPQLEGGPIEVPVDFTELKAKYPDIYAWIQIPGTRIDYPILQHESDNSYYLNHTYDGRKRLEGSIYTENYNSTDFSDPNTVIYGHDMKNGSMFKGLHKYKDKQFFEENSKIIIYQEGRILTYKIFAAYTYDNRHLMLSFDFDNKNIFETYLNNVLTNQDKSSNINVTIPVSSEDRIITLSTCTSNEKQRYLVQAVLLSIQE